MQPGYNIGMNRIAALLVFWCLASIALAGVPTRMNPSPQVTAKAAILLDRQTGVVLWQNTRANISYPMASTTKLMTAMVILDHGAEKLDQLVTVSSNAAKVGGSSVFGPLDTVTLRDLLIAALVRSSNEATVAAAEYLAGDEHTFVGWMNAKASAILGPRHKTHFVNPHGLHHADHYSSAHDMAEIARYALMQYPLIGQIAASGFPKPARVTVVNRGQVKYLGNRNRLLTSPVPGLTESRFDGLKTGFVKESGSCLVSSATCNDWQLIAVVFDSKDIFADSKALMQYGFTQYRWKMYASDRQPALETAVKFGSSRTVPVGVQQTLGVPIARNDSGQYRVIFQGETPRAPLARGEDIGTLIIERDGKTIASARAIALQSIPEAWWWTLLRALRWWIATVALLLVIGRIYGTIAKSARRRRRLLATRGRGVDPQRTGNG